MGFQIGNFITKLTKTLGEDSGNQKKSGNFQKYREKEFQNQNLIRRGRRINMILVLWFWKISVRMREIYLFDNNFLSAEKYSFSIERQAIWEIWGQGIIIESGCWWNCYISIYNNSLMILNHTTSLEFYTACKLMCK